MENKGGVGRKVCSPFKFPEVTSAGGGWFCNGGAGGNNNGARLCVCPSVIRNSHQLSENKFPVFRGQGLFAPLVPASYVQLPRKRVRVGLRLGLGVGLGWGWGRGITPPRPLHAPQLVAPKLGCPTPRPGWREEEGRLLGFLPPSIHLPETCIEHLLKDNPGLGLWDLLIRSLPSRTFIVLKEGGG